MNYQTNYYIEKVKSLQQERDALKAENEQIKAQCEYEFTAKNDAIAVLWGCEERVEKLKAENVTLDESLKAAVELNEQYAMQNTELLGRLERAMDLLETIDNANAYRYDPHRKMYQQMIEYRGGE